MNQSLVMTILASDRPGIVERISACVADHGGNWLESRMCRLAGRFVGLARVEIDAGRGAALRQALLALEASGCESYWKAVPAKARRLAQFFSSN